MLRGLRLESCCVVSSVWYFFFFFSRFFFVSPLFSSVESGLLEVLLLLQGSQVDGQIQHI